MSEKMVGWEVAYQYMLAGGEAVWGGVTYRTNDQGQVGYDCGRFCLSVDAMDDHRGRAPSAIWQLIGEVSGMNIYDAWGKAEVGDKVVRGDGKRAIREEANGVLTASDPTVGVGLPLTAEDLTSTDWTVQKTPIKEKHPRPTKPGYFWCEDSRGGRRVIKVYSSPGTGLRVVDPPGYMDLSIKRFDLHVVWGPEVEDDGTW